MKKSILFVIDSLDVAGAEKSLISLLTLLDYSRYTVDLQLFGYGHALEAFIPDEVELLEPLTYTTFAKLPLSTAIIKAVTKQDVKMLISRLTYTTKIRLRKYNNPEKAILYWKSVRNVIRTSPKRYDIAISYAQGVPTYYVAEKVQAKKKLAWVNVSYHPTRHVKLFQTRYYDQFDSIVAVSDTVKKIFTTYFPDVKEKVTVFYDMTNPQIIFHLSETGRGFNDDFDGVRILTVGRLVYQKGYDLALEACRQLKEAGVHFRWYAIGKGPLQEEIEQTIEEKGLEHHFHLLGVKINPYPFYKQADIYVQTSRFEGFGIAISEARMLNTPVVTTEFDSVYNQMVHGKNGLVVKQDANAIAQAIKQVILDDTLRNSIRFYLRSEKKGNTENIKQFYELIQR